MKTKRYALAAFLSLLFSHCATEKKEAKEEAKPSTPVTITHVQFEPMTEYVELNANSGYQKKSIVRASTTGIVTMVQVNPGDKVNKGQVLFTITTKEAAALLEKNATQDTSFHFKGVLKIIATQSGVVSSVAYRQGDFVQEGDQLATIAEQSSLVFYLQAPYELSEFTRVGQTCQLELPNNKLINGTIGSILPSMDMQAQTLALVVKPSSTETIPENLIAKVRISKHTKNKACSLPKESVLTDETQSIFWVMKLINDSTAVRVTIEKGIEANGKVEIAKPELSEKDRILLTGNYGLEDTAKVNILIAK